MEAGQVDQGCVNEMETWIELALVFQPPAKGRPSLPASKARRARREVYAYVTRLFNGRFVGWLRAK